MFAGELETLLELLDLERLERDLFRGVSPRDGRDRIFGGQVLGQALMAAQRTVEGREAHSLHGYFLRPGDPQTPIVYDVDRIRDGRSFATRRVVAVQDGSAIFNMSVSFQTPEAGLEHQIDIEPPPPPGGELYEEAIAREMRRHGIELERDDRRFRLPIEVRSAEGFHLFDERRLPPFTRSWIRTKGALPDDPALHRCVLAYASDLTLMVSAIQPHPVGLRSPGVRTASLDHAMWFHRPFRIDEWLFFVQESPVSARARGFARGALYDGDGTLVASCAQEGMLRAPAPGA